jgi:hypothetical protein
LVIGVTDTEPPAAELEPPDPAPPLLPADDELPPLPAPPLLEDEDEELLDPPADPPAPPPQGGVSHLQLP